MDDNVKKGGVWVCVCGCVCVERERERTGSLYTAEIDRTL